MQIACNVIRSRHLEDKVKLLANEVRKRRSVNIYLLATQCRHGGW